MKKILYLIAILIFITNSTGCQIKETNNQNESLNKVEQTNSNVEDDILQKETINNSKLYFPSIDETVNLLSIEDDYISKLSEFDYISKFKTDHILNEAERKLEYKKTIILYSEENKEKLEKTYNLIVEKMKDYKLNLPKNIWLANSKGLIESGAAYTRGNMIVMPEQMVENIDDKTLEEILTHEIFHVYSRYNKDKREELYNIIHYQKCESLDIPEILKGFTISNPDAPDLNYYINSLYEGKAMSWIPITYSNDSYDVKANKPFFAYLKDDMLAVKIIDNKPVPILVKDKLVIVSKNQLSDYYDLIGRNTNYTYHPEETLADNFVLMIQNKDEQVDSPWVIEELRAAIKGFSK